MSEEKLLVINPGGTSLKAAYFIGERQKHLGAHEHDVRDLSMFSKTVDQLKYRLYALGEILASWGIDELDDLSAVVARGGPLKPMQAGTYKVNATMVRDVREGLVLADHASLLGCLMAYKLTAARAMPAFIVDPVSVDEMRDVARVSGLKKLKRKSLWHALNSRHVARLAAKENHLDYRVAKMVVVHLGSGISVSAIDGGRAIDVNNANDMGPFSPTRTGGLPTTGLIELCFKQWANKKVLKTRTTKEGGLVDLLGTADLREVERRMQAGDEQAKLVWRAMAYQVAKEIGAMCAALGGRPDAVVMTGGMAHSERLVEEIRSYVETMAERLAVYPGEFEMEALAMGALRVLRGEEEAIEYSSSEE